MVRTSSPLRLLLSSFLLTLIPLVAPPGASAVSDGLVIPGGTGPLVINVTGDLTLHGSDGVITVAALLEIRAAGDLVFDFAGTISATTLIFDSNRNEPFPAPDGQYMGNPFHISVAGPLDGPLQIFSSGDILITDQPVPEPSTALLLCTGLAAALTVTRRARTSARHFPF